MPLVRYTPEDFAAHHGALLQEPQDLAISWTELLWADITVGRRELQHVFRHGEYSWFEISYRAAILYANLCEMHHGRIERSAAYDGLDPSEKGAISYFLGMAITKAAIHRLCAVPWLMHLDVYRAELSATFGEGRTRPDLVGQDALGRWVVVESKGRTNGFDLQALERAKLQAQSIVAIGGEVPYLAIGTLVHFEGGVLQLHLKDPDARVYEKVSISLTRDSLLEGYYRPFRAWLLSDPTRREITIRDRAFVSPHAAQPIQSCRVAPALP